MHKFLRKLNVYYHLSSSNLNKNLSNILPILTLILVTQKLPFFTLKKNISLSNSQLLMFIVLFPILKSILSLWSTSVTENCLNSKLAKTEFCIVLNEVHTIYMSLHYLNKSILKIFKGPWATLLTWATLSILISALWNHIDIQNIWTMQ